MSLFWEDFEKRCYFWDHFEKVDIYQHFGRKKGRFFDIILKKSFLSILCFQIRSARNSKTFKLCLSVRPSKRKELRTSNFANRLILAIDSSVHRIWYLPNKPNRYIGILDTWKVRFAPNLIFRLVYQLLITLPKIMLIGLQGPVPPI